MNSAKIERLEKRIKELERDLEMEKLMHQATNKERLRLQERIDVMRGLYDDKRNTSARS